MLNMPPCVSSRLSFLYLVHAKSSSFSLRFYFPSPRTAFPPSFFFFSFFSPFGPNHSAENVKPAVLGMLPNETVLLNILFLPKYFQSSWRAVRPQWLSAAFPSSISPGFPSTALSNWILFEEEGGGKLLHETVCRFKNYPLGTEGQRSKVLSCQTPELGGLCINFRWRFQQGDLEEKRWQWSKFRLSFQSL